MIVFVLCAASGFVKDEKGLKAKDAQRLIVAVPGTSLSRSAVVVREVTTEGTTAVASASVRTAFRLREVEEAGAGGKVRRLRVAQIRVGDRQWEDAELFLRALGAEAGALADVESLTAELVERQARASREKAEREAGGATREKAGNGQEAETKETPPPAEGELRRGVFTAKGLTSMLSGVAVEAEVEMGFRFTKEAGKWRVGAARVGGGEWRELGRLSAALDAEKAARARAELAAVGAALESFRRERGFYVVSDSHVVLIDHLNPRHLAEVIRVDPWHRPYRYRGTVDSYLVSSDGADGRAGTADDVTVGSRP